MSEALATFMFANMARPPVAVRSAGQPRRFGGAVIRGATLVVAGVICRGADAFAICETACEFFVLEGREQRSLRSFKAELEHMFGSVHLDRVLLKASAIRGPYTAAPLACMIEASLAHVKSLSLETVSPMSIAAWVRGNGDQFLDLPEALPSRLRDAFAEAATCACINASWHRDPSSKPAKRESA